MLSARAPRKFTARPVAMPFGPRSSAAEFQRKSGPLVAQAQQIRHIVSTEIK